MLHRAAFVTTVVILTSLVLTLAARADNTRVTITGVSKALVDANADKMDSKVAYATVTVTASGTDTVYYIYGWGGVICARNNGKTVEVTGIPGTTTDGKNKITAASVGVKVIVVK
jgi:hypothetical protein